VILHAGLVALHGPRGWRGALIEGASGAGKSDLALRCLDLGLRLVADDRVVVWSCEGRLFGRAPDVLHGLLEVRGLGVRRAPALRFCEISLVARCGEPERLPEPEWAEFCGVRAPAITIQPLEASAPAKMRRALEWLGQDPEGAYLAGFAARLTSLSGGDTPVRELA
jgi:serine kinase of HPr protein (carbohydrate metabolism regulator)